MQLAMISLSVSDLVVTKAPVGLLAADVKSKKYFLV